MLLASSLFFAASVNAAGVNLIVNGSFEDPDVEVGGWEVYDAVTGWSTSGAGIEIRDNVAGTAYIGDQFAELDTHHRGYEYSKGETNSSIFQTVNTILGQSYLLSFAYAPRINKLEDTNGIEVFWNNKSLASVSAKGGHTHNWTVYEYIVTGTGSDVLQFSAIGAGDTLGGSLDAVSVSAVPIPAALFLFAPALLGFLGLRHKRA